MSDMNRKYPFWSLYFEMEGFEITGDKLMGRQAAGNSFLKALVKSKTDTLGIYIKNNHQKKLASETIKSFLDKDQELEVVSIPYNRPFESQDFGGIFFPGPSLSDYSKLRGYYGHHKYSLIGITHTTASHRVMTSISSLLSSPVKPWDALICTSQVVVDTVTTIIDAEYERLESSLGVKKKIIPLGVDPDEFDYSSDFILKSRNEFNIKDNDIVIVYVGRLSFHAKAHHIPMYISLNEISKTLEEGQNIHLIQTGWFANEFIENSFKDEAKLICPDVIMHFLDGKDQGNKHKTLACGDIFMSLSDNFQETFGLTPLEGMAAGLPVIVSDWNGYRDTVKDSHDGFRIPTYSLKPGNGEELAFNHMMGFINYDEYIGHLSQKIAIDIPMCIDKLQLLIGNKDLRKKLGNNAKNSVRGNFSWQKILNKYKDLGDDLDDIRVSSSKVESEGYHKLPSDRLDPFYVFKTYPTNLLDGDTFIFRDDSMTSDCINEIMNLDSVKFAKSSLPDISFFYRVYEMLDVETKVSINDIIKDTELNESIVLTICIWFMKYSFIKVEIV